MDLDGKIICILVVGIFVGLQFQVFPGEESLSFFIKNIISGQALSLWIAAIYKIAIKPVISYFEEKPFLKDIKDIYSIVHDFLPKETYSRFRIQDHGKTIDDMYDSYFAILIWIWVDHLKRKRKDYLTFIKVAERIHFNAVSLYNSLSTNIEDVFLTISVKEVLTLTCPGDREDYIRRLSYATHWASRNLIGDDKAESELANVFGNLLADFVKANDL